MDIISRALSAFGYSKKSFMAPSLDELFSADKSYRLPDPTSHSYGQYLQAYGDKKWVYVCVSRILDAYDSLPLLIFDAKGKPQPDDSDLMKLLYRPNPIMNGGHLRRVTLASLELTGNAYWLLDERKGEGIPAKIWPLSAASVKPVRQDNPAEPIKAYRYNVGSGKKIDYSPKDIIHFRYPNPNDLFYGLAPLAAARATADIMQAADKFNRAFFDNSATVSGILSTEQKLDDASRKRIVAAWNSKHQGEENANKMALLEGGLKWQALAVSQRDMEFIGGQKLNREDIMAIFGVPPAIAGIFEYANYANAKEQHKMFWGNTIFPKAKIINDMLTEFLLPIFDKTGKLYFDCDKSGLLTLLSDVSEKASAAEAYQRMGFTRNEVIAALGLPFATDKSGDYRYEPQYVIQSFGGLGGLFIRPEGKKAVKANVVRPTLAQMRAHQKERHSIAIPFETRMIESVGKTFSEKTEAILKAVKASGIPKNYAAIFDKKTEAGKLAEAKLPVMKGVIDSGKAHERNFISELSGGKHLSIKPKSKIQISDWAKVHAEKWAAESEDFTEQEINAMLADVEEARQAGDSVEELKRQIKDRMDGMESYRARRIAQTETLAALNQSAISAYSEIGEIAGKGWLATLDEATRESHAQAGEDYGPGNEIGVDEDFEVGDGVGPAPGQLSAVGENVNCRCTIYPVVKKEA